MPGVFLFLSTGRCGTQWLASSLREAYEDEAFVTHEPIGWQYRPNRFLRSYDRLEEMLRVDKIRTHLDFVERTASDKTYIETGWPSFAAIPLFRERFGDDLAVVHLLRHPVPTAVSYVTLGLFAGRDDDWARHCFLDPGSPGVVQSDYEARWPHMTPYEKLLFGWTEVHMYGRETESRLPPASFLRITAEDLFRGGAALRRLPRFLGLEFKESLSESSTTRVDAFRFRTPQTIKWRRIFDHPETVKLAEEFGYDFAGIEEESLAQRYRGAIPGWRLRSWRMKATAKLEELARSVRRIASR